MEHRWKIIDTVIAIIVVIALGFTILFSMSFYTIYFSAKEVMEKEIQFKMSEKGFYFGPFYKAYTESGSMHHISKQQYEEADVLTGYQTDRSSFFTKADLLIEFASFLVLFLLLLAICLFLIYYFYWKFYKKGRKKQIEKRKGSKKGIRILLFGYVGISLFVLLFLAWNTVQQVIPIGQTETEARILDREIVKRNGRYAMNEHYITVSYEDSSGDTHTAKQRVYAGLYEKYEHDYGIPIRYTDRQPANIFISLQSLEDMLWMVLLKNVVVMFVIIYGYERMYRWFKKKEK